MSKKIGVIGFGGRMADVYKCLLNWQEDIELTAILDRNPEYSEKKMENRGIEYKSTRFYTDEESFFAENCFDGIMIGTNCNTHAYYAAKVIEKGIPLFLEKPVAITEKELDMLSECDKKKKSPVIVSFPLRVSKVCDEAKRIVDSGALGEISQVQACNNVNYARGYYKKWYRDDSVTGGLFLQKATHDIDCIMYLLGNLRPVEVCAVKSKQIFKGDKPAGLHCRDCDEYRTCPESPYVLEKIYGEAWQPDTCSFAVDTGNEDSGTVILVFENGLHAVYTQNFVARKDAGKRMIRIIGFKATLEMNFYTGIVEVFHHDTGTAETIRVFDNSSSHYGGDDRLTRFFLNAMDGETDNYGELSDGILSARVCLRARESSERHQFMKI